VIAIHDIENPDPISIYNNPKMKTKLAVFNHNCNSLSLLINKNNSDFFI